jgi:hypothetical protein
MDVETALKRCEDLAAMVRALADGAAHMNEGVSPEALSGMGDTCATIEQLAHGVRKALRADALEREVVVAD